MSLTYAIADLHGRFDLFSAAMARILGCGISGGTIVTLGDYVDRGPESRQLIEALMEMQQRLQGSEWNLVCLRGNHEEMMVETVTKPLAPDWWFANGGSATMRSYGQRQCLRGDGIEVQVTRIPEEHIRWMANLPQMRVDKHRVYVHAGVDPKLPLDQQREDLLTWMCYPSRYAGGHGTRHIVHGHQQFGDGPLCYGGRTNLDTFAWATGRLVVGVFDDDRPGGPIDFIEVLADPAPGYSRESKEY